MSGIVVCDSGPLIALGGVDCLPLLKTLFSRVVVPQEVATELMASGEHAVGVRQFKQCSWLEVAACPSSQRQDLAEKLDDGEASVIVTALQHPGAVVLMDEIRGRNVARSMHGLKVIGTGRVLLEAKRRDLIPKVKPLLSVILANGYWMSDRIMAAILQEAGEQKS